MQGTQPRLAGLGQQIRKRETFIIVMGSDSDGSPGVTLLSPLHANGRDGAAEAARGVMSPAKPWGRWGGLQRTWPCLSAWLCFKLSACLAPTCPEAVVVLKVRTRPRDAVLPARVGQILPLKDP